MSSAVIAGASSCSAAFTSRKNYSIKTTTTPSPKTFISSQKTTLQGLSLQEAKRGVSDLFLVGKNSSFGSSHAGRGLEITARTAGAAKNIGLELVLHTMINMVKRVHFGNYYCYIVKPGVFVGGAFLALPSVVFGIFYYLTLNAAKDTTSPWGNAAVPNQGGIIMGQPQFPQS